MSLNSAVYQELQIKHTKIIMISSQHSYISWHFLLAGIVFVSFIKCLTVTLFIMPPTSEEVEGAYWFGSVRPVQCSAVSL